MTEKLKEANPSYSESESILPFDVNTESGSTSPVNTNPPTESRLPNIPLPKLGASSATSAVAMKNLLMDKRFQRASLVSLTAMCVIIGFYATSRSQTALNLKDPFSCIKHSDTVDGYILQAQILDAKGNHFAMIDGWQKALECAREKHYAPVELGKLYLKAGDKLSNLEDHDAVVYETYIGRSSADRELAKSYYETAISLFQKEKLTRMELVARYRIADLQRNMLELDKDQNLRAILDLEKDSENSRRIVAVNYDLGMHCELEGNYDDAAKYLLYAIKYDPEPTLRDHQVDLVCSILRSKKQYGELVRLLEHLERRRLDGELSVSPPIYLLQQLRTTYEAAKDLNSVDEVNKAIASVTGRRTSW